MKNDMFFKWASAIVNIASRAIFVTTFTGLFHTSNKMPVLMLVTGLIAKMSQYFPATDFHIIESNVKCIVCTNF